MPSPVARSPPEELQKAKDMQPPRPSQVPIRRGILHVYGWTGVLMVVAFLLSGLWTLELAVIQLAPSQAANYVMGTAKLDGGDFWTLQKSDDSLAAVAALILIACACCYFGLVVMMIHMSGGFQNVRWRQIRVVEVHPRTAMTSMSASTRPVVPRQRNRLAVVESLVLRRGRHKVWEWLERGMAIAFRAHDTPALALPKLLLQTTMLFKYLREGFPQTTIIFYASLLVLNWMISTYCAMARLVDPRAPLVRIFYSFDLFFAVFAPLQMIMYAYHQFYFDSAEFTLRLETLNPANFDVIARLFADPSEVSHFRAAFRSLQLSSLSSLAIKVFLNALTIQRWWRTIKLLGESTEKPIFNPVHYQRLRRVDRVLAILFFGMGAAVFIYSVVCVISSQYVCARFVHCKAPSYRWNVGVDVCSCSVFVDRVTQVKTFDEWVNPIDTTANLAALAASGDLKIVQVLNRQLPTLPEELRRCHGLEQLILIYTKTITMPEWTKEFTNLEYLHLEGDLTNKELQALPRDLFHAMQKLAFVHLGCLRHIPFVPDLDHNPRLRYLTMAMLHSVTELPGFEHLGNLERLYIADATHVAVLPPVTPLKKLKLLMIGYRNPMCCNGYMNEKCDLTNFSCLDRTVTGEPRVECVSQHITPQDQAVINAVTHAVCETNHIQDLRELGATREVSDEACGGVIYARCELNGVSGMCYPARMMVITCYLDPSYEKLRRRMIELGVGAPCDPVVEQWLGCKPKIS